jgi:hypothetical protein
MATECVDVASDGSACYLKGSVGSPQYNGNVYGALKVGSYSNSTTQITATPTGAPTPIQTVTTTTTIYGSAYTCQCTAAPKSSSGPGSSGLTCPSANGTTFTGSCGSQYGIECGVDRGNHDSRYIPLITSGLFSNDVSSSRI